MTEHLTLTVVNGQRADHCAVSPKGHRPAPSRFVWHHILPQVCGGPTLAANLVSLCDNCHYSVHALLWQWAFHPTEIVPLGTNRKQLKLAMHGYNAAVAAGTVDKIPRES